MIWVLVWAVLVLAAVALLGLLGRRLWRQLRALASEVGAAGDRFAEVAEVADRLADLEQLSKDGQTQPPDVRSPVSRQRP